MSEHINDVPPPGHFIREELEARGWHQRDLAWLLGVPEQSVNMIVSGKRGISAEMAKALGGAFDVDPAFFANLQQAYDLSRARDPDPGVARRSKLQTTYPVREMIKRGWLVDADATMLEAQMAAFFEVKAASDIPRIAHAARKTDYSEVTPPQLAWLYRVRQIARSLPAAKYSEKSLREALPRLRTLMVEPEEARQVPRLLSECGVRFVVVETLPNTKIDGVCFWLDGKSPVIGMSIRHDRIDNFWFVLRHEIEHVLRHHGLDGGMVDAELEGERAGTGDGIPEQERVANAAASDFCIPTAELESFFARKNPFFSERDVLGFAKRMGVHPGIAAGQLRRRTGRWELFARMLVKVRHAVTATAVVDGWGEVAPVSG